MHHARPTPLSVPIVASVRVLRGALPAAMFGLLSLARLVDAQPLPGQIVIDPQDPRWLQRHEGRPLFICGPGEPEDFLYRGPRRRDGTRDGDQLAWIDQLVTHGGNCLYLQAVRTHGGDARDDRTQNPFVDSDPARGIDARILEQWEQWFARMDEHDIVIYFEFYDDGARIWDTGDDVGPEEQAFFETLVRRFKHHRNLIWVVGEESEERYSTARVQALARVIRQADEHAHPIGNHHQSGTLFKAWRPGGALNHFSMQYNRAGADAHAGAVEAFHRAEGRYNVIYSESTTAPTDPDGVRRHAWGSAMAGVMPILYNLNVTKAPIELLAQCRHLQRFFEATDFTTMVPADDLATGATAYVLADAGRSYIAYGERADGALGLRDLPAGRCLVTWLDCRTGARIEETHTFATGGDREFRRPAKMGADSAAWIRFPDLAATGTARRPAAVIAAVAAPAANITPAAPDQKVRTRDGAELYIQLAITDADGPGPYTYTIVEPPKHGTLTGDNNDRFYTPKPGFAGADEFTWKVNDGHADSRVARVTIFVPAVVRLPPGTARYFPPPESQGGWRKAANAEEIRQLGGMDPAKLDALREWLLASDKRDFAAVVIRHGRIVLEVERGNSAVTDSRRVASVSKAICATVLAIASELSQQGGLPRKMSFDDRAFDFIPWAQPLSDPRKAAITVRQLFNTTSGICPESTGASNLGTWDYVLGHSGDPRTARLAFDPGTGSGYSTLAVYHAALVCETVTGLPYDTFAIKHLFEPIGCEHWWFQYFEGSEGVGRHPNHSMGMPARDLARIAYCLLRGGRWNARQIVPSWFVEETAAPSHDVRGGAELRTGREPSNYSHAWERPTWLTGRPEPGSKSIPGDARFKRGSGGQLIAFVPSLDLVVTRQTGGSGQWSYEEYLGLACDAVLPAGKEAAR